MYTVTVRDLEIGAGCPKICVPVVETSEKEIINAVKQIVEKKPDLIEWRVDWFADFTKESRLLCVLEKVRGILGDIPLLFTIRTNREGGEAELDSENYRALNLYAASTGLVDLIDVEAFQQDTDIELFVDKLHAYGVKVVGSNHDFVKTPEKEEIVSRLIKMQEMGMDILKIAVMPQTTKDVVTLLDATDEMVRMYAQRPVVTISMGKLGMISRISGNVFGSSITFGATEKTSAPGQIEISQLKEIISILT